MSAVVVSGGAGRIRPGRTWAYLALIVVVLAGTAAAGYRMSFIWVPAPWGALVFGSILIELLWRFDLCPTVEWNRAGVAGITPFSAFRMAWSQVNSIEVNGNEIVLHATDEEVRFSFDRMWWLARLSETYGQRGTRIRDAMENARQTADSAFELPDPSRPARPWAFYVAFGIAVAVGAWLAPFLP